MRRIITYKDGITLVDRQGDALKRELDLGGESSDKLNFEGGGGENDESEDRSRVEIRQPDDYLSKVAKLIPVEIVATFITIDSALSVAADNTPMWLYWGATVVLAILCPLYMIRATRVEGLGIAWSQVAVSTLAFPIWVYAIGGPFEVSMGDQYNQLVTVVLIPLFSLITPFFLDSGKR